MELSKSTQEVITQAQMLRLETGAESLCLEHVYYGLLLMASYLDAPMNAEEYRKEAKELRKYLETKNRSIASAKHQLSRDAKEDSSLFVDARPMLGRAAEMAGSRQIAPMDLAKAIQEDPSPTIRALNGLKIPALEKEDARYSPVVRPNPQPQPVKPPVQPVKPPVQPVKPPVQPVKPQSSVSGTGVQNHDLGDIVAAIQQLDRLNVQQKPKHRKTRLGLITFRGGRVSAAVQYFLIFGLLPFGLLFALQHFTGYVCTPPGPWAAFGVRAFVVLWAFLICRGIGHVIGFGSRSFGLFLRILMTNALVFGFAWAYRTAFELAEYPVWMKYVCGVLGIVILALGTVLFERLKYTPAEQRKRITYGNYTGRTGKVMFQMLMQQLIPPALFLGIWWIHGSAVPDWSLKAMWIVGFISVWGTLGTVFSCLALRAEAGWSRGTGKGFFKFMRSFYTFMVIPLLVLFLHWLFDWNPVQLWVWIVLGVYTLLMFAGSVIYARN